MERSMSRITLKDRVRLKWNWVGRIARMPNERWIEKIMEWRRRQDAFRGRGSIRWTEAFDIKRITNTNWTQRAQDRNNWELLREISV